MENWLERTELLIGSEKIERLKKTHVLIVGLGGRIFCCRVHRSFRRG